MSGATSTHNKPHHSFPSNSASSRTPLPATLIARLQSPYPFFFTANVCCPGVTEIVEGVLPTNAPSTSISAPATFDSTVTLAISATTAPGAANTRHRRRHHLRHIQLHIPRHERRHLRPLRNRDVLAVEEQQQRSRWKEHYRRLIHQGVRQLRPPILRGGRWLGSHPVRTPSPIKAHPTPTIFRFQPRNTPENTSKIACQAPRPRKVPLSTSLQAA